MVKEFDLDPTIDVWLVLDLDETVQAGEGDDSTEEYGVTIAASLANYFLLQDLSVGMIINDTAGSSLPMDRGARQTDRALELLAVARASEAPPLADALGIHEISFMRSSALIVITSSPDPSWVEGLRLVMRRGVHASAIVLDGASFGATSDIKPVSETLGAIGAPALIVHRGDNLGQILETGMIR